MTVCCLNKTRKVRNEEFKSVSNNGKLAEISVLTLKGTKEYNNSFIVHFCLGKNIFRVDLRVMGIER